MVSQANTKKIASIQNFSLVLFTFLLFCRKSIETKNYGGHQLHKVAKIFRKTSNSNFSLTRTWGSVENCVFVAGICVLTAQNRKFAKKSNFTILPWQHGTITTFRSLEFNSFVIEVISLPKTVSCDISMGLLLKGNHQFNFPSGFDYDITIGDKCCKFTKLWILRERERERERAWSKYKYIILAYAANIVV